MTMPLPLETPADPAQLRAALARSGYAWLTPPVTHALTRVDGAGWRRLRDYWSNLPRDPHLKDGGRYRARRHGSLVQDLASEELRLVPHRAHWQPVEYNALHGGMQRWFEPLASAFVADADVQRCLRAVGVVAAGLRPVASWFVEVHQVRIDTTHGIGRPTPEGAHRDGVDFVVVWLVGRDEIRGGETRVFEAEGPHGVRFTMDTAGSALVLDDRRVVHETTPVLPGTDTGVRDTLVVTYRAGGFLSPG